LNFETRSRTPTVGRAGLDTSQVVEAGPGIYEFVAVARVVRPHGRRGEVVAEILTDFPERVQADRTIYIEAQDNRPQPLQVDSARIHKGRFVLKFSEINSIEQAEALRARHILIPVSERATLPSNSYYIWELEGCRVLRDQSHGSGPPIEVGTVAEVEGGTGGVDLLHVTVHGRQDEEVLIPLAASICKRIDVSAKVIVIDPPEDLLELNR
jgi:16S rRNA processing protein RimM